MKTYDYFASKGTAKDASGQGGGVGLRVVNDNRQPIYVVYILDSSGSMSVPTTILNENGEVACISKIEQLNQGVKVFVGRLKEFEENNPMYKIYIQIIMLDSYGKAVFPEFQPVSRAFEEIRFDAEGCTELRASLSTLKTYINAKYLRDDRAVREDKGYNKAVSVILMSDGWPTDCNGVPQSPEVYRGIVNDFKQHLREMDYERSVDLYSVAVGDDACEDMLKYFCDGGEERGDQSRFYRVEECESIANVLDFLTRATLARHASRPIVLDDDDDNDNDDDDLEDDIEDEDLEDLEDEEFEEDDLEEEDLADENLDDAPTEESDATLDGLFDDLD